MAEKKSFVVYHSYEECFEDLTDDEVGKLFRAMLVYSKTGVTIKLPRELAIAFRFLKSQMDADSDKYDEKCKKNKDSALKRWKSNSEDVQMQKSNANECTRIQTDKKNADVDIDVDVDVDVDNDVDSESDIKKDNIRFRAPTLQEIEDFCKNENLLTNPQLFHAHYDAKGWRYPSGAPMVNWRSEVRKWDIQDRKNKASPKKKAKFQGRTEKYTDNIYADLSKLEV